MASERRLTPKQREALIASFHASERRRLAARDEALRAIANLQRLAELMRERGR